MFSFLATFLIFAASKRRNREVSRRGQGVTLDESPRQTKKPSTVDIIARVMLAVPPIVEHYDHFVRQPWRQVRIVYVCRGDGGKRMANAVKRRLNRHVGVRTIYNAYFLNFEKALFKIVGKSYILNFEEALFKIVGKMREGASIVHCGGDHTFDFLNDYTMLDLIEAVVNHQTTVAQEWEAMNLDAASFYWIYGFMM